MRKMMFADDDLDVDAEVIRVAEDFDDSPDRRLSAFRELEHFHIDDDAVQFFRALELPRLYSHPIDRATLRRQFHSLRNRDPLLDPIVGRHHKVASFADAKFADDGEVSASQNADQLSFRPAFAAAPRDVYECAIAVHCLFCLGRRQKDVFARRAADGIRNQKPESVPVDRYSAHQVIRVPASRDKVTGTEFNQEPFFRQPVERIFERIPIFSREPQFFDELFVGCFRVGKLADMLDQAAICKVLRRTADSLGHLQIIEFHQCPPIPGTRPGSSGESED